MVVMSPFNESDHPRGQATNAGQFRAKANTMPTANLAMSANDLASQPIGFEELVEMQMNPDRYAVIDVDHSEITSRRYAAEGDIPSRRLNSDRPSFMGGGERDFHLALERIDAIWDPTAPIGARSDELIADMRRSGALGVGGEAGLEAYARAIVWNESGGYLDEEQVNHPLDHIQSGGTNYRNEARAFGYHPEQYVIDVAAAARAASYREAHAENDEARLAAAIRRVTLTEIAGHASRNLDRGWSTREDDIEQLTERARRYNAAATNSTDAMMRSQSAVRARACQDALDLILRDI
ncbi:hypothetical protein HMPREF1529_02265 [Microbacterium sp. oral taxon 186 str. F0373]|nr:hypothetical protein HMPREF1529_02265 [Microbacterium sp. oral taxon 186 str. F0373]